MKGRMTALYKSMSGKQVLTVELDGDISGVYKELTNTDVDIEIKKHYKKRSLSANSYAWVLIDKIAAVMNLTKIEVYRNAIREIGGVSVETVFPTAELDEWCRAWESKGIGWIADVVKESKLDGYTRVCLYKGSSVYDVQQMSCLIDALVQDAQELGIETKSPQEIASLIAQWGDKHCQTESSKNPSAPVRP